MNPNQILSQAQTKLTKAEDHFKEELAKIRTGRAHPSMLDGVNVEVYGQQMPLKAVAGISTPEPQLLQISPFDPNNLKTISDAIRSKQDLGLSPTDDGRVVRITIPPLTTESRQQMTKSVWQKVEQCLISARQARHEAMHDAEQAEKDKQIGKDERARLEKQIDEKLAGLKTDIESLAKAKEADIMKI